MDDAAIERIVQGVVAYLSDRRGLRQQWDQIDEETKEEILEAWRQIIRDAAT
jgi:hypothetical protein